jgi:hypothetical protein
MLHSNISVTSFHSHESEVGCGRRNCPGLQAYEACMQLLHHPAKISKRLRIRTSRPEQPDCCCGTPTRIRTGTVFLPNGFKSYQDRTQLKFEHLFLFLPLIDACQCHFVLFLPQSKNTPTSTTHEYLLICLRNR